MSTDGPDEGAPQRQRGAPIPFPGIDRHGVIGNRRTAALVASDGTIDWLCVPAFDGEPVLGALLDAVVGGHLRLGPVERRLGRQRYLGDSFVLETAIDTDQGQVVITDAMLDPEQAGASDATVIVRRLTASGGSVDAVVDFAPRDGRLWLWSSHTPAGPGPQFFRLDDGDEAWLVVGSGERGEWSAARARGEIEKVQRWWEARASALLGGCPERARLLRSMLTIELLTDVRHGASVAAPTVSLPERVGGDWNADYRLSWVRDGSLSAEMLARGGDVASARRYLEWLLGLGSSTDAPLQVVYRTDGGERPEQRERHDFAGYRETGPVRFGNHAYQQKQLGIFGYLGGAMLAYQQAGGPWKREYLDLVSRCADHVARCWQAPDNGIWELPSRRDHVSSRVLCWAALSRAASLCEALGEPAGASRWRGAMRDIEREVLEWGWSERLGAFRHAYDTDALDASALLIPIVGFLPLDDRRVRATVDRIADELTIEGWVHRFVPSEVGLKGIPMAEYEGAFVLCTAWLANAYSLLGEPGRARGLLERIERAAGPLGLLPEGIDARSGDFRGNYPLLFSHAEYMRAVLATSAAERDLTLARPGRRAPASGPAPAGRRW